MRRRRGKRHRLIDVILISLLAMLCGCDDADEIAVWAEAHEAMLQDWFGGLEHGTPSQDTILRIFSSLNPKAFDRAVTSWLRSLQRATAGGHIAIDGKSLRGSLRRGSGKSAVHIVSAWLREAGISLGQIKTHDKSNEIKAIPELLDMIEIAGCTISIDAAGCHKHIVEKIVAKQGFYLIAVKENQPTLYADCVRTFLEACDERRRSMDELEQPRAQKTTDVDGDHGRIEERTASLCSDLQFLTTIDEWPGLKAVGLVESCTTDKRTGKVSQEHRYYIIGDETLTAEGLLKKTRDHWSIESMHWVLDVVFAEDASHIYDRRAAENFSLLRRSALSLLKAAPVPNGKKRMSYKNRRHWCQYFPEYLLQVLLGDDLQASAV